MFKRRSSFPVIGLLIIAVMFCVSHLFAGAKPKDVAEKAPFAGSVKFEDRIKNSKRGKPPKVESIAFPHPYARNILAGPTIIPSGKQITRYPDPDKVIWTVIPKTKLHDEYLEKRKEMLPKKHIQALVSWCLRNKLNTCAEYELRSAMFGKSTRSSEYQSFKTQWYQLAKKRYSEYSFALPVKGIWHVFPDKTGHHKLHHGAAFAWDLVITQNKKFCVGKGKRLEDHYCWAKPFYAQADGIVTRAVDKYKDAPAGQSGGYVNCNVLSVDYGGGIKGYYGHLKQGSLKVKVGDRVTRGQELALVGNSGRSVVPHLHFVLLDSGSFAIKGRYCYQVWKKDKWVEVEGEDLDDGMMVRDWDPSMKLFR